MNDNYAMSLKMYVFFFPTNCDLEMTIFRTERTMQCTEWHKEIVGLAHFLQIYKQLHQQNNVG